VKDDVRGLEVAGANLKRGRLEIWRPGWPERNAGARGWWGDLRRSWVILLFRYRNYYWTVGQCEGREEKLAAEYKVD
jgi:hypothetical protein